MCGRIPPVVIGKVLLDVVEALHISRLFIVRAQQAQRKKEKKALSNSLNDFFFTCVPLFLPPPAVLLYQCRTCQLFCSFQGS